MTLSDRSDTPTDQGALVERVNIAQPATLQVGARTTKTGIRKEPQRGRIPVTAAGLSGDHVLNRRHHGGPDQAVYVYFSHDLDVWTEELGERPDDGAFGENLLVGRWASAELRVGDRLDIRGAGGQPGPLLEITAPRIPCATLAANMHDPAFVKRFTRVRRPGAYTRVLRGGTVGAGDSVTLRPGSPDAPTLGELFDLHFGRHRDLARVRELLAFPLAIRLRQDLEQRLSDAT